MNELKKINGIDAAVAAITEELEARCTASLSTIAPLATIVTTADNLAERKADRANINKVRKEYDDERKQIEKEWKNAIGPISQKYKEFVAECDQLVKTIDADLKEFEEQRIEAKRQIIRKCYETVLAHVPEELEGWRELEDLYDPRWENATYKETKIIDDMSDAFAALKMSYDTLTAIHHEWEGVGLGVLRETGDLQRAIAKMNEMAEHQQMIERRRKEEEERKAREEAERKAKEEAEQRARELSALTELADEAEPSPMEFAEPTNEVPEAVDAEIDAIDAEVAEPANMAPEVFKKVTVLTFDANQLDELMGMLAFGGYIFEVE